MPLSPLHPECLALKNLKEFRVLLIGVKASESLVIANGCRGPSPTWLTLKMSSFSVSPFFTYLSSLILPNFPQLQWFSLRTFCIITIAPHLICFFPINFYPLSSLLLAENGANCGFIIFVLGVGALWRSLDDFCLSWCSFWGHSAVSSHVFVTVVVTSHYFACQINAWSVCTNRLGTVFFLGQTVFRFRTLWRFLKNTNNEMVKILKVAGMSGKHA